jgi:hypothetical protein
MVKPPFEVSQVADDHRLGNPVVKFAWLVCQFIQERVAGPVRRARRLP